MPEETPREAGDAGPKGRKPFLKFAVGLTAISVIIVAFVFLFRADLGKIGDLKFNLEYFSGRYAAATDFLGRIFALVESQDREISLVDESPPPFVSERTKPRQSPKISPAQLFKETIFNVSDSATPTPSPLPSPKISPSPKPSPKPSPSPSPSPNPAPTSSPASIPSSASLPKILISEIQIAGPAGANDEFIELFNPNSGTLALTGWSIKKKSSTGNEYTLLASSRLEGKTIPGRGYFLATNEGGYQGASITDVGWAQSNTIASNNTILLYAPDRIDPIDKVGFGSASDYEGVAAPGPENGQTLSRASASDTDNNDADFILSRPTPRNSSQSAGAFIPPDTWVATSPTPAPGGSATGPSPTPTPSTPAKILINEIQITGGPGLTTNDFIEVYNPNSEPVNLNGYRLVKRTATGTSDSHIKSWTTDIFIAAHGFYLWANSNYIDIPAAPDATTTATVADNNGIAIRFGPEDTGTIIDSVGWGGAANIFVEAQPFTPSPGANQSIQRRIQDGSPVDTDNNANDFEIKTTPTPKSF